MLKNYVKEGQKLPLFGVGPVQEASYQMYSVA